MGIEKHLPEGFEVPEEPSDRPSFWSHFWREGVTPWDLNGPHPELVARIRDLGAPGRAYIPGCGRGHDAAFLNQQGWQITAVDMAPEVEQHLAFEPNDRDRRFLLGDAFEAFGGARFDLWWDHTFFCAIPPARRGDWGRAVLKALEKGGLLGALIFPFGNALEEGGPPFGMTLDDMLAQLGSRASVLVDEGAGHPGREGGERFGLLRITPA